MANHDSNFGVRPAREQIIWGLRAGVVMGASSNERNSEDQSNDLKFMYKLVNGVKIVQNKVDNP